MINLKLIAMKNLIFGIILIFFCPSNLFSQLPTGMLVEQNAMDEWILESHIDFSYDSNENLILENEQSWNEVGSNYENHTLETKTYDESTGLILTSQLQYWLGLGSTWVNWKKEIYEYSPEGMLETKLYQTWTDQEWLTDAMETYSYDENNNLTSLEMSIWSDLLQEFTPISMSSYVYDVNVTTENIHEWEDEWILVETVDRTINTMGNIEFEMGQNYDNGIFTDSYRAEYEYDVNQNLTSRFIEIAYNGLVWAPFYLYEYTFNTNGTRNQNIEQIYNGETQSMVNVKRRTFEYGPSSIEEYINDEDLIIYPNPSSDVIQISGLKSLPFELTIYDLSGRQVISYNTSNADAPLNINSLSAGTYVVEIFQGGNWYSKKFSKE